MNIIQFTGFLSTIILSSCLSSGRETKQQQPDTPSYGSSSTWKGDLEFLVSECSIIVDDIQHTYNFYRSSHHETRGSIFSTDPVPPLSQSEYAIYYETTPQTIIITFDNAEFTMEINNKNGKGTIYLSEQEKTFSYTCDDFKF